MLLLTGPPGSGKTSFLLRRIREDLGNGRQDLRLLVPTATMAEHRRNELAREGFVFRPSLILTLSKFVAGFVGDLPQPSAACLDLLVGQALNDLSPAEFRAVARYPGFRSSLTGLIDELTSAGSDSASLERALGDQAPPGASFLAVLRHLETALARRGLALPSERLRRAANRIRAGGLPGISRVFLDGFFTLAQPEIELLDAIRFHADLTVTLPDSKGAGDARLGLLAMGLTEQRGQKARQEPSVVLATAGTIEQEAEDVARRILEQAAAGRALREMGIVVRARDPCVPVLRAALERFGIPARIYFAGPLADHAAVRFLSGLVDAMLGGWEHEAVLRLLQMSASGLGGTSVMDEFEYRVRERLPGMGLDGMLKLATDSSIRSHLHAFARLDGWRDREAAPDEWAIRLRELPSFLQPGRPPDSVTHETALAWRGCAQAIQAFRDALDEAAEALSESPRVRFRGFWEQVRTSLRLNSLRVPDRRRNVVHVIDVYEARQWELPVVFVCGLLEKQFPLYHPQNPILADQERLRLNAAGVSLRTASERDEEERFLFELATTRATSLLVLTHPKFNEKGDETLRSFLLDEFLRKHQTEEERALPVRPQAARAKPAVRPPVIRAEELLEWLRRCESLSPTAVESFLQCPFQFFAGKTLKLEGPPAAPSERLDRLVQGNIAHTVLARWMEEELTIEGLFDAVFEAACRQKNVPSSYLTEAVRRGLLRDLQNFVDAPALPVKWNSRLEQKFELLLEDGLEVRGRIDRLDVSPAGEAFVIDYKYSSAARTGDLVKAHEDGTKVQAGLYLLAAEKFFGHRAVGAFFAALRGEVAWKGWHLAREGFQKIGISCVRQELELVRDRAVEATLAAARKIRDGVVEPKPADPKQCENCAFRDVCRVESSAAIVSIAGGAEWD